MKRVQFLECVHQAKEICHKLSQDQKNSALENFSGCYFTKGRIFSAFNQFCYVLNYQAMQLNGEWDTEELKKMEGVSKRVDLI